MRKFSTLGTLQLKSNYQVGRQEILHQGFQTQITESQSGVTTHK